jgi:hypothetical protein
MRVFWGIVIFLGVCVFFIPGLWVAVMGYFLPEVIVLEGHRNLGRAYSRGTQVSSINAGRTLATVLLLFFLRIAFAFVLTGASATFLTEFLQVTPHRTLFAHAIDWDFACVGWLLFSVIHATSRFLIYINIRGETEAWDVQARFLSIHRWIDSKASEIVR